jgi:hypothetical protein
VHEGIGQLLRLMRDPEWLVPSGWVPHELSCENRERGAASEVIRLFRCRLDGKRRARCVGSGIGQGDGRVGERVN